MGEMIAQEIYGPLKAEGKAEDLILILTNRFGENRLSGPLTQTRLSCTDSQKLTAWIKVALDKKTTWAEIEKFQNNSLI
jgi:hypothetical protein